MSRSVSHLETGQGQYDVETSQGQYDVETCHGQYNVGTCQGQYDVILKQVKVSMRSS